MFPFSLMAMFTPFCQWAPWDWLLVQSCRRQVVIRDGISFHGNSSEFLSDHNQWLGKQRQRFFQG